MWRRKEFGLYAGVTLEFISIPMTFKVKAIGLAIFTCA